MFPHWSLLGGKFQRLNYFPLHFPEFRCVFSSACVHCSSPLRRTNPHDHAMALFSVALTHELHWIFLPHQSLVTSRVTETSEHGTSTLPAIAEMVWRLVCVKDTPISQKVLPKSIKDIWGWCLFQFVSFFHPGWISRASHCPFKSL